VLYTGTLHLTISRFANVHKRATAIFCYSVRICGHRRQMTTCVHNVHKGKKNRGQWKHSDTNQRSDFVIVERYNNETIADRDQDAFMFNPLTGRLRWISPVA